MTHDNDDAPKPNISLVPTPTVGITDPGFHLGISHAAYHADPCVTPSLSASMAHCLIERSALYAHQQHPRLGAQPDEDDDTEESEGGSLLHDLLLGGGPEMVIVNENDWRKKDAQNARKDARAAGKLPVLAKRYEKAATAAEQLGRRLADHGVDISAAATEVTMVWRDPITGAWCRSRLDLWFPQDVTIVDLKTCPAATPTFIDSALNSFGRQIQRAANVNGVETLLPEQMGRVTWRAAFLERKPPYDVRIAEMAGSLAELGERQWRRAIGTWARCLRDGVWPGNPKEIHRVEAKPWVLIQDQEREAEVMGNDNDTKEF